MNPTITDKLKGSVTLALEDYHRMVDAASISRLQQERLQKISEQIETFLSFLSRHEVVQTGITEFNSQSTVCQIHLVDNRVKIEMKEYDGKDNTL
jgi:hypothetical protein